MPLDEEPVEAETLEEAGILEADVGAKLQARAHHTRLLVKAYIQVPTRGRPLIITPDPSGSPPESDQQLAGIDPSLKINMDPQAHRHLRPEMMFIREELRWAKLQTLAVRRTALKKLLMKDFLQENRELQAIGLSYALRDL